MKKIQFITDSACDISEADAKKYEINILSIPITVNGQGYYERKDFTAQEFYQILLENKEIPVTSHITNVTFLQSFKDACDAGSEDIIVVTINSKGSNMYNAATMAKQMFAEEYPELAAKTNIYIIDSKTYSIGYGVPILRACELREQGKNAAEIVDSLNDMLDRVEVYFSVFSLDFAKKSGRISVAAAFVGEVLGLRPIMSIIDGDIKIIEKIRGDKSVAPRLAKLYSERSADPSFPYVTAKGVSDDAARELAENLTEEVGYAPAACWNLGASITINSGPKAIALMLMGEKRNLR